jgi:hypothetical protein
MQRRSGPCRGIARGAAQLLPGLSTAEAGYAGGPTTGAAPSCVRFACRVRLPRWWRPWTELSVLPSVSAISTGESPTMWRPR